MTIYLQQLLHRMVDFLLAGTSYSGKGLDKKEDSKGGSDIWLIRINEFGDELWQKTLGSSSDEEARDGYPDY